jgi:hypothetical protein
VGQILAILKVLGGLMISRDREVAGLVKVPLLSLSLKSCYQEEITF